MLFDIKIDLIKVKCKEAKGVGWIKNERNMVLLSLRWDSLRVGKLVGMMVENFIFFEGKSSAG